MEYFIGCSGFHYREWKKIFYPEKLPQKSWFEYYCRHFNTIELNVSFYKFPTAEGLKKWFDASPEKFVFSVKAPRLITHYKQLKDCERLMSDFYGAVDKGLGKKLGSLIFQFPPHFVFTNKNLELITKMVGGRENNVVEFRDPTWWTDPVIDVLKRNKIIFCGSSHPGLPEIPVINNKVCYYRFHGIEKRFYSLYSNKTLLKIFRMINESGCKKAFIYFNNTATDAAIINARYMQKLVGGVKRIEKV